MNNQSPQSPFVPQGSTLDQKNRSRARVKLAVFFVLALHGVGLLALLLQGCHREETAQNNQNTNTVPPLMELTNSGIVATEPSPAPIAPTNPAPLPEAAIAAPAAMTDYTVAKGDTFATIARSCKVSTKAMMDANPGVEATKLQVGQKLHVPAPTKTATAAAAPVTTPGEQTTPQQHYTVKSGDTLIKIATEHHTTAKAIRAANSLKTDRITVGPKLKMPVKVPTVSPTETASANTMPSH